MISVVIPTRNRSDKVQRVLEALLVQVRQAEGVLETELLVVDDASEDRHRSLLAASVRVPGTNAVNLIQRTTRGGPGTARNDGVRWARGHVIAFLDDDCLPEPGYLAELWRLHRAYPDLLVLNGHLRPYRMHRYAAFWQYYYDATFRGDGEVYPVPRVASGHFSIKRELLALLDEPLFDETLPSREDYDLYLRLEARGVPVYKADRIVARIECRDSLWAFLRQRAWYAQGERRVRSKYGAARIREEQRQRSVPPAKRFLPLYLALRVQRFVTRQREKP